AKMSSIRILLIVALFQYSLGAQKFKYPELRRDESVVDDYYGMKVQDPYRYLEDPDSEETTKFVIEQNKLTEEYLSQNSVKESIEKKLTEVYNYPKYGVPRRYGSRYFSTMNTGLQNQDVYYVQDTLDSQPQVFFDPNTLSEDGTVHLSDFEFSDDGELVALALNSKGSDWLTIRIRNVSTGEDYSETLEDIKFSAIAWTNDNVGFFYARYPKLAAKFRSSLGTETVQYGNQKLYYHRVGTNQSDDVLVAEFEDPLLLIGYFEVTENGNYLIIFPSKGSGETMVYYAALKEPMRTGIRGKLQVLPIVDSLANDYSYVTAEGSVVYLQTNNGAPNYRVVGIDLNKPEQMYWTTLIPEHNKNTLDWAYVVNEDKLVLKYLEDVKSRVEIRSLHNGTLIQHLQIPLGAVDSFGGKKSNTEFFFRVVSFLTPGIIYRVDLTTAPYEAKVFKEVKVNGFDPSSFTVKQVFYPSKDGTLVPMFIVHKKSLKMNSNANTFIYGYGGFNINIVPTFKPDRIVFLQNFNGVYAVPNIRGGGEYGQKWHEGGRLLNKQNVFDDFQAAAEFLIRERYTTASKIAINGGSNGGLLVGACVNQRPDLYGAGIAQVGVHDLLRFQKFTIGYAWCSEYGCSDNGNKTIFDNLYRLSPLHNVRLPLNDSVQYPAVLLTTGDHDDRVVPLHSYKLIAELQYRIGRSPRQTNPLLIKIQTSAGHGAGKPTSKKIAEYAEMYAFLVESAGFVFTP
ncbi:Prolyl endopeptidase, partial [Orchesella cincta]